MNIVRVTISLLLIAAAAVSHAETKVFAENPDIAGPLKVLDAWIQAAVTSREEPGLSIAIVHDQDLIWSKGYGYANVEKRIPATPSTLYRIASISKVFTSTALLQLRDAGKLHLDDPVSKYLPWFQVKEPKPDTRPITIWHLITHTSGLARELPMYYWNDLKFPSREEMMQLVLEEPAVFPPETEYKYSNLALAIAGEVVAAVSGEPYKKYVEDHILKPLGMSSTLIEPSPREPNLAVGYRRHAPGVPREVEDFIDARALTPSAGLASNVNDLAKFVSMQFRDGPTGGSQILKGSTLREMQRVQWLKPDWQSGQGVGFGIRHVGNQTRVGKDGAAPGYKSLMEWIPAEKLGVIVLINGYDADPTYYVNQVLNVLGPAVVRATAKPRLTPLPDPSWTKYVGTYEWKHVEAQIMIADGELILFSPESASPWESRVRLTPVSPDTFKMIGGPNDGELLKFELDKNGHVIRFTASSYFRIRKSE
jgi:CubicO group peptidase (beta-lactamase class C family)